MSREYKTVYYNVTIVALTPQGDIALKGDQLPTYSLAGETVQRHVQLWLDQNKVQAADVKIIKYRNIIKGKDLNIECKWALTKVYSMCCWLSPSRLSIWIGGKSLRWKIRELLSSLDEYSKARSIRWHSSGGREILSPHLNDNIVFLVIWGYLINSVKIHKVGSHHFTLVWYSNSWSLIFSCLFSSRIVLKSYFSLTLVHFADSRLLRIVWRLFNIIAYRSALFFFSYFRTYWVVSSSVWSCFAVISRAFSIFFCFSITDCNTSSYLMRTSFYSLEDSISCICFYNFCFYEQICWNFAYSVL